jgi:hypothetical protein
VSTSSRNLILGASIAALLTVIAVVPTVAGISTWKWALAAVGLILFVLGGRSRRP